MHMYRVIQISPLLGEHIIALHGQYEEAVDHADRCNVSADEMSHSLTDEAPTFTYHADADPVEVSVGPIEREDTK